MSSKISESAGQASNRQSTAVHRLTHDVLHYMFSLVHTVYPTRSVALSHVSQSWRFTSLSSPFLWTHISMRCRRARQQHPMILMYLRRSKNCRVAFHLYAVRPLESGELESIIYPYAHRFRQIDITASNYHLVPLLWKQLSATMSPTNDFKLNVVGDMHISIVRAGSQDSDVSPFSLPPVSRNYLIYWSSWNIPNVTSLTLNYLGAEICPDLQSLYDVLLQCQNSISYLEYQGFAPKSGTNDFCSSILFPVLESLTLGYIDNIAPLMEFISAPELKSLKISDVLACPDSPIIREWREYPPYGVPHVLRILQLMAQFENVTRLELFGINYCPHDATMIFMQRMTKVEYLVLYETYEEFAEILFDESAHTVPIFPMLTHLLTTAVNLPAQLIQFISGRTKNKSPLQKLTLTNDALDGLVENMDALREGAIEITAVTDPRRYEYTVMDERVVEEEEKVIPHL